MEQINERIANRLVELRNTKGWSLDQLAQKSDVSRASLSRLEKGEVAASAEMLAKVCKAYDISLSRLIMMAEETFEPLITPDGQPVWEDPSTGFTRRSFSPPSRILSAEVVECRLPAGTLINYDSSPSTGMEHHLLLMEGKLTITVDTETYQLSPGDCLRYVLRHSSQFESDAALGAKYLLVLVS